MSPVYRTETMKQVEDHPPREFCTDTQERSPKTAVILGRWVEAKLSEVPG